MSPTDTFTRFVDVVADALDDHDLDGDAIAGRAHMSRYHFDRVVSAASGETPTAFRRRIKLERAAYQLIVTHRGVLDVLVDAGYGPNEAFTRAFAGAYGRPPSSWRRNPGGRLRLEAPSGVHFRPPEGLRVPARTKVTGMELFERIVSHHVWLVGEIVDRVARLDTDVLDRPIDIGVEYIDCDPTLRSATSRLIGQLAMWNAAVAGRAYDFEVEREESVPAMRARLAVAGPEFEQLVHELVTEGRLDESFVDAICERPEVFTYGGMLAHVIAFGSTRRTIVIGTLTSAGIDDLGAGDPMRWVAEAG